MAGVDVENDSILVTIPQWNDKNRYAPNNDGKHVSVAGYLEAVNKRTEPLSVEVLRGSGVGKSPKERKLEDDLIAMIKDCRKTDGKTDEILLLAKLRSYVTRANHRGYDEGWKSFRKYIKGGGRA